MITANIGKNLINCYDGAYNRQTLKEWADKNIILCPACSKPYEYCHGKVKSPYFRHKDKSECEYLYSEPETEEHINGKVALFNWIKDMNGVTEARLEGWIPETKQRPDIMFKYNDEQYVIEYQCTPISSEYIERHKLYQVAGIKDIWILGTEKYKKNWGRKYIEKYATCYFNSKTNDVLIEYTLENFVENKYIHRFGSKMYYSSIDNIVFSFGQISFSSDVLSKLNEAYIQYKKELEMREQLLDSILSYSLKKLKEKYPDICKDHYDKNTLSLGINNFVVDFNINWERIIFDRKYFVKNKGYWICKKRKISYVDVDYNNFDFNLLAKFIDFSVDYYETVKYCKGLDAVNYAEYTKNTKTVEVE